VAPIVYNEPERSRFTATEVGMTAELVYARQPGRITLVHTGVPDGLSGTGIGGALVRAAVDLARDEGLVVVPVCPFARRWLRRHPDVAETAEIDWAATARRGPEP
jgi:uncharacterized protein